MFFALGLNPSAESAEGSDGFAYRLCRFALKTINEEMGGVFEKFVPVFDQDAREFQQQGETHAQFTAYQEYLSILEQHLVRFAAAEGYGGGNAAEFLEALRQNVAEDKANAEQEFQRTWQALKDQFSQLDGLGEDADVMLNQLREFYKPQTVEDLMQTVLNMLEYETFSQLMRAKVHKVKLMQEMERRKYEMMNGEMGLAHRFIEYAVRVLNREMEPFYVKCTPLFRQSDAELLQQGHTIEQYVAFQEFIQLLEGHFSAFVEREGYGQDTAGFLTELQRLAQKDKERLDDELAKTIKEVESRAATNGGTGDGSPQPVLLIVKPTSIADLINYFVNYTEYDTFSSFMRGRIREEAFIKQLLIGATEIEDEALRAAPQPFQPPTHSTLPFEPPTRRGLQPVNGEASTIRLVVPEGCRGGSQVTVPTPDGRSFVTTIPEGLSPGMTFEVPYQT
jgi:hypothetical protein|mmetsp:Transcript_24937/g.40029  ORF Transcript_24937/g.40029 Transcript_24937/m.40029 type:complete len:450 (-) Transcript_24937:19-1368(-)